MDVCQSEWDEGKHEMKDTTIICVAWCKSCKQNKGSNIDICKPFYFQKLWLLCRALIFMSYQVEKMHFCI